MDNANSDTEQSVLCEKIIDDLQAVLLKDIALCSFEIIPTILNCNKSPVIHVEHNLGLESWSAKHVYEHAHHSILNAKHLLQQQKHFPTDEGFIKYLNAALLINPDVTSFWNVRRRFVQNGCLHWQSELKFSALVLSKKPKSSEAFSYRRWLLTTQPCEEVDWPAEIEICEHLSNHCSSNYHAWSHRLWVLNNTPNLLASEIQRSEQFMRKHISDYSCYHYRQQLLIYAYKIGFSETETLDDLFDLKALIGYYVITDVRHFSDVLDVLLPDIDREKIDSVRLHSFLYCCNLAAHDVRLCDEQKNIYGERESFDLHRRTVLKFIIDTCVHLLKQSKQSLQQLKQHSHEFTDFLASVKESEGLLGAKHRKWCSIFLGFHYNSEY